MKLMDKIKNLFLDEEEYDDEEEEFPQVEVKDKENKVKKEKKELLKPSKEELPKVMLETIKKEEDIKSEKVELKFKPEDVINDEKKDEAVAEQTKKFNFPIDLNEEFPSRSSKKVFDQELVLEKPKVEPQVGNVNVLQIDKQVTQKVTEMYSHREEEKVKPKFKASPVISPVYGVLDKNYRKEEVKEKSEEMVGMKRPSKKVDFETVRKKAFGNLTDEIKDNMLCENCELYKEVKRISALKEDDLLYDMTVDEPKEKTIEKAYDDYEEFGVVYEPKTIKKAQDEELEEEHEEEMKRPIIDYNKVEDDDVDDKDDIIDLLNKSEEKEVIREDKKDDDVLEELPSREKKKDTKVDADFFELIDSMYKERVDE